MIQSDGTELRQVTWTDPYRQPPLVDRLGCDIADTKIDDLKAVLVGIKTPIASPKTFEMPERLSGLG